MEASSCCSLLHTDTACPHPHDCLKDAVSKNAESRVVLGGHEGGPTLGARGHGLSILITGV